MNQDDRDARRQSIVEDPGVTPLLQQAHEATGETKDDLVRDYLALGEEKMTLREFLERIIESSKSGQHDSKAKLLAKQWADVDVDGLR